MDKWNNYVQHIQKTEDTWNAYRIQHTEPSSTNYVTVFQTTKLQAVGK